jgi:hypothetical protein
MPLFHPRNFIVALLPFIVGNTHLSAFDIPVELPSGQVIHLNMEYAEVDPDSYSVYMKSTIKDPEELRFFSENPEIITETMSQSLKEKWEFDDFSFELSRPLISLTNASSLLFRNYPPLTLSDYSIDTRIQSSATNSGCLIINGAPSTSICQAYEESLLQNDGTLTLTGSTSTRMIEIPLGTGTFFTEDQIQKIKDGTLKTIEVDGQIIEINFVFPDEKIGQTTNTSEINHADVKIDETSPTNSSEIVNEIDNIQEKTKEDPIFFLSFSTSGNNFGGGWRLSPYELRFVQKQESFWDKGYPSDGIETMAVLVAPDECEFYQKQYAYPEFFPAKNTSNVLIAHPDSTFMLRASLRGTFFFNHAGQLIRSLQENCPIYSTYDYSDEKLTHIRHADCLDLSFEYEGKKIISINGLPNRVHLEYDDRDLLCKIFNEQSSFLQISYDEDRELDKIVDDAGTIVYSHPDDKGAVKESGEIPLLFNGFGELFYYKNSQNLWKLSYRSWTSQDDE